MLLLAVVLLGLYFVYVFGSSLFKQSCTTTRQAALQRADLVAIQLDRAYRECPFDNPDCKQLHVDGPTPYERREVHFHESFYCGIMRDLLSSIPGADATDFKVSPDGDTVHSAGAAQAHTTTIRESPNCLPRPV